MASKEGNMRLHVNCTCAIGMPEPQPFVASKWYFAESQLAKTAILASLKTNGRKRVTTTKAKM